jgi:hypothetical protein
VARHYIESEDWRHDSGAKLHRMADAGKPIVNFAIQNPLQTIAQT